MNFLGSFLSSLKPRFDDDIVDRLNYYYTCLIILILAITISAKQYVGQPIQCWVPAQFTGAWEQYAENYCFVQNTYWLPLKSEVPRYYEQRAKGQIGYYQWVPFILAIEALLFYVPCVIWRLMNWQSGINVQSVVTMAADSQNITLENRQRSVKTIARHIDDAISLQYDLNRKATQVRNREKRIVQNVLQFGKSSGAYVTLLYLMVKLLYLANVVGQFFLLTAFLGTEYDFWGAEILVDLANGKEWNDSGHFPRVTMCDFEVRVLGNLHRYTIQCVLMINMFNEKIFLFLWWWFLFIASANVLNFIYWLFTCLSRTHRANFVEKYLRVGDFLSSTVNTEHEFAPQMTSKNRIERRTVRKFVDVFLRYDGVFMLRMISTHAGDLIATEIIASLWRSFSDRHMYAKTYSEPEKKTSPGTNLKRRSAPMESVGLTPRYSMISGAVKIDSPQETLEEGEQEDAKEKPPGEPTGFVESYYVAAPTVVQTQKP